MTVCPDCTIGKLYSFKDRACGFLMQICWNCGYYQDNSPAYRANSEVLKNMVRYDPNYFLKKCFQAVSKTPNLNRDKNNESDPDNLPVLSIKTLII